MIIKMTIFRLLGSSDEKEKIGIARPEGPPLRWFPSVQRTRIEETSKKPSQNNQDRDILVSPVELTLRKLHTSVH